MHNDGRRRGDYLRRCNETVVFGAGFGFAGFRRCNAHAYLPSPHMAYDAFACGSAVSPNNRVTRSNRLAVSPDISALAESTPRIASRPARRSASLGGSNFGM